MFLRQFFNYEDYMIAISKAKQKIAAQQAYRQNWVKISSAICNQSLLPGQPLQLVHYDANQVINESSDQEAYVWSEQMVKNVERTDGVIKRY